MLFPPTARQERDTLRNGTMAPNQCDRRLDGILKPRAPEVRTSSQEIEIRLPLVIRARLGPYLHTPLIIGWLNFTILYLIVSGRGALAQNCEMLIVSLSLTMLTPVMAYRYQVRVDNEYLWYRTFLFFERIPLSEIERIDCDRKGIISRDGRAYEESWYVHPRSDCGASGFRLSHFYMTPQDRAKFLQLMHRYFSTGAAGDGTT